MLFILVSVFIATILGHRIPNEHNITPDEHNSLHTPPETPNGYINISPEGHNSLHTPPETPTTPDEVDDQYDCIDTWKDYPHSETAAERIYYIGCVEEEWDYAPSDYDKISGERIAPGMKSGADRWLYGNGYNRIGRKYIKSRYIEYTDLCFNERKEIGYKYTHLGIIGPLIRAITGEKIKIYYQNHCKFPNSMHPHGVLYDKKSEGAPYDDNSEESDIVEPGNKWIYIWEARDSSVDDNVSSQMWLYHSHVHEVKDVLSGLIGGIIITKKGYETSYKNLLPTDVSREFITFFVMFDENESWFVDTNMQRYLYRFNGNRDLLKMDRDFYESNYMHSINGYLFGNLDSLTCTGRELVRWYTASFGKYAHSPHWHGNLVKTSMGQNVDTIALIPGTTDTVTMHVDGVGKWLYHCHVFNHQVAGMITTYTAEQKTSSSSESSSEEGEEGEGESGENTGTPIIYSTENIATLKVTENT